MALSFSELFLNRKFLTKEQEDRLATIGAKLDNPYAHKCITPKDKQLVLADLCLFAGELAIAITEQDKEQKKNERRLTAEESMELRCELIDSQLSAVVNKDGVPDESDYVCQTRVGDNWIEHRPKITNVAEHHAKYCQKKAHAKECKACIWFAERA